jgi:carbamoyltransferase
MERRASDFRLLTSVPIVLNISSNENEPVVCLPRPKPCAKAGLPRPKPCAKAGRPEEALDCFLRTKMDVLVLGGILISRSI